MAFICTSLPLNLYTSVFGCGCGFGFEQIFWRINGFSEKRQGSADLHTPIHPSLKWRQSFFTSVRKALALLQRVSHNFSHSEVRILQCSWFGNITTNEFKQSDNISQPSKAYFMMITVLLKWKLFEVQRDSTSQTDGTTCIWFTMVMQIQKFNNTTEIFCFFRAISTMTYVL